MANYVNEQVIELNEVTEENRNKATRSVKSETQLSDGRTRLYRMAAVCLGVLCVLQVILNISLRLAFWINICQKIRKTCPDGWRLWGSSCYFLSTEMKTWEESRLDCLNRGANLVIINSKEEQEFLFGLNKGAWIGLSDSVTEGTWKWVDGTPLTTPSYWYSQQPDNGCLPLSTVPAVGWCVCVLERENEVVCTVRCCICARPPTSLLCCNGDVKPLSHKSSNDCVNMTGHSMPLQDARFLCSVQHSPPPHFLGCHHHYQVAVSASNYRVNKTEKKMNKHFDLSHALNTTGVNLTMKCLVTGPFPTMQS
uniref:C-type lectin domain family 4 member M n=1 Tax=Oncorhynchus kisutch TaxID=8019 RepID=A0A8C7JFP0_ONCKI